MDELETIRRLYADYLAETERLARERRPGDGLLGMGGGPSGDPCHDRFAEKLTAALERMAREDASADRIRAALEYIYRAPLENRENLSAYWMLLAVHGLTVELAERMDPPDKAALRRAYQRLYPRWERLPAQKRVLDALKTR